MNKRGKQTRAGKLLSQFIRQIAEEETELVKIDGEDKMVTKAEALARLVWKKALGYKEIKIEKGVPIEYEYRSDKGYAAVLFDRMEGRAPTSLDEGDEKLSVAERVSEQGKKRINKVLDGS